MTTTKTQTKQAWLVTYNADGTEGRGPMVIRAVCEKRATAIRLSKGISTQGSDGDVEEVTLRRLPHGRFHRWYGPVDVVSSTRADDAEQQRQDKLAHALAKAREAGLTDEELETLRGGRP